MNKTSKILNTFMYFTPSSMEPLVIITNSKLNKYEI